MKVGNIVVLHGWAANRDQLKPLITNLEKGGWNVFFPKLPGFDDKKLTKAYDLEEYAQFVSKAANVRFDGKRYIVFGHSFGGRIAVKLSLVNEKTSGLILCASGGFSRGNIVKRFIFYVFAKIGKLFLIYKPLSVLFKNFLYKFAGEHDYEKTSGFLKVTFRNIVSEDLKKVVRNIKVPTLIFWGMKDKMTPYNDAKYINRAVLKSKLVSYVGEGHTLPYTRSDDLVHEIEKWYQSLN